jgi:DNA adenine methylase
MKYMGSKNRYAKHLLPIILKNRREGQCYVEPFVGGANMIDKVDGWRIGCDINEHIIILFKAIQGGYQPPEIVTEAEYNLAKNAQNSPTKSFIGFGCSYSGKWFGGYARGNDNKGVPRNYADESRRNILKQAENLKAVDFRHCCYKELSPPSLSIVYCDPPYEGTTKYRDEFNHGDFWQWCRQMVSIGHEVFISEYQAPDDFVSLWEKEVNSSLTKDTGSKKNTERLFKHRSQL